MIVVHTLNLDANSTGEAPTFSGLKINACEPLPLQSVLAAPKSYGQSCFQRVEISFVLLFFAGWCSSLVRVALEAKRRAAVCGLLLFSPKQELFGVLNAYRASDPISRRLRMGRNHDCITDCIGRCIRVIPWGCGWGLMLGLRFKIHQY